MFICGLIVFQFMSILFVYFFFVAIYSTFLLNGCLFASLLFSVFSLFRHVLSHCLFILWLNCLSIYVYLVHCFHILLPFHSIFGHVFSHVCLFLDKFCSIYVYLVHCCLILLPFHVIFIHVLSHFVFIFVALFSICVLYGSLFLILFVAFHYITVWDLTSFTSFFGFYLNFLVTHIQFCFGMLVQLLLILSLSGFHCLCIISLSFLKCSALFLLWL